MARDIIRVWESDGFRCELYDTHRRDWRGQTRIGYTFTDNGADVFTGEDFCGSPLHADDSNATVASLLTFLSLRKGDTDGEYFDSYTPEQLDWRDSGRAELLSMLAHDLAEAPDTDDDDSNDDDE